MNLHEFIDWFEDSRAGTRRLISIVPTEAFDFRQNENAPTIEQIIRAFASLEYTFIKGVCTGEWTDSGNPSDIRRQIFDTLSEEAGDPEYFELSEELDSAEAILDHLDRVHQECLDILAALSENEFQTRIVKVPWGEEASIARLLLGLVEREIHHRTELYLALQQYGIRMNPMILWGP